VQTEIDRKSSHLDKGPPLDNANPYPVTYGDSGVMAFVVKQNGIVFERNLGPQTRRIARQISEYDGDSGWHVVP
jgi:hypothetical protein